MRRSRPALAAVGTRARGSEIRWQQLYCSRSVERAAAGLEAGEHAAFLLLLLVPPRSSFLARCSLSVTRSRFSPDRRLRRFGRPYRPSGNRAFSVRPSLLGTGATSIDRALPPPARSQGPPQLARLAFPLSLSLLHLHAHSLRRTTVPPEHVAPGRLEPPARRPLRREDDGGRPQAEGDGHAGEARARRRRRVHQQGQLDHQQERAAREPAPCASSLLPLPPPRLVRRSPRALALVADPYREQGISLERLEGEYGPTLRRSDRPTPDPVVRTDEGLLVEASQETPR